MGQKTHPIGFRLGIVKDWNSSWFTDKHFSDWLNEDLLLRKYVHGACRQRRSRVGQDQALP